MKECFFCKTVNIDSYKYCKSCGKKLDEKEVIFNDSGEYSYITMFLGFISIFVGIISFVIAQYGYITWIFGFGFSLIGLIIYPFEKKKTTDRYAFIIPLIALIINLIFILVYLIWSW